MANKRSTRLFSKIFDDNLDPKMLKKWPFLCVSQNLPAKEKICPRTINAENADEIIKGDGTLWVVIQ